MTIQKWGRVHHRDEDCPNKIAVEALQIELTAAQARITELEKALANICGAFVVICGTQSFGEINPNYYSRYREAKAALSPKEPATQPEPPR